MSETTECPTCAGTGAIATWDPDSGLIPPSIPFEYATYSYVREQARERVITAAREAARGAVGYEALDLRDALAALDRLSEPKP